MKAYNEFIKEYRQAISEGDKEKQAKLEKNKNSYKIW
jgi:hypothetical protein